MSCELKQPEVAPVRTTFVNRLELREAGAGIVPAQALRTGADRAEQYERLKRMIGHTPLLLLRGILDLVRGIILRPACGR